MVNERSSDARCAEILYAEPLRKEWLQLVQYRREWLGYTWVLSRKEGGSKE